MSRGATFRRGIWSQEPDKHHNPGVDLLGFENLHVHLRDGRWLVRGIYLRPAADPALMLKPGFTTVDPPSSGTVTTWDRRHQNDLLSCTFSIPSAGLIAMAWFAGLSQAGDPLLERYRVEGWERHWTTVAPPLRLPGSENGTLDSAVYAGPRGPSRSPIRRAGADDARPIGQKRRIGRIGERSPFINLRVGIGTC